MVFWLLLKKISGNQYLKILDFSQFFVADIPMQKKIQKLILHPLGAFLGHSIKNYLDIFAVIQKNVLKNPNSTFKLSI